MEGPFRRKFLGADRRRGQERRQGEDRRQQSRFSRYDDNNGPGGDADRGVIDWLEQEGRQERRSGRDRRGGEERRLAAERRGTVHNRRDERRLIPFSVAPRGEVRTSDNRHWHITLWDVSLSGLCVVVSGTFDEPLGSELQLALYEVVGLGSMFFKAKLRWFANDEFQTYLGLQFSDPDQLPPGTFLERYLAARFET